MVGGLSTVPAGVGDFLTIRGYDLVGNSPSELRALIREESVAHKAIAEKYKLGS